MVRVRDAKPEELAPKPRKPKAMSPRQLAIKRREQLIEKVLNELGAGPASWIKKIELEDNEKLVTIRAAVARQIKTSGSTVNLGVRNGAIFLSRGPIPGGRGGGRRRKSACRPARLTEAQGCLRRRPGGDRRAPVRAVTGHRRESRRPPSRRPSSPARRCWRS